jgi:uncharacterized membrane protein YccC
MTRNPTARQLVADALRIDRKQITFWTPLRNALGVVLPLAVGMALGQTGVGLSVAIGALQVAFTDRPGPYRLRAGRMLLAGLWGALSVFVGATTGAGPEWVAVGLTALWGFGAGLLAPLSPAALQIGLTGVIVLLVFGAHPLPAAPAAGQALLVLAGAGLQTLLAVAPWPVRRSSPERHALAALLRGLGAYMRAPSGPDKPPPASAETTAAISALTGIGSDHSAIGEALRTLLDEAERLRLELMALERARFRLRQILPDAATAGPVDALWAVTAGLLTRIADAVATGEALDARAALAPLERAGAAVRAAPAGGAGPEAARLRAAVEFHVEALIGQLRAMAELAGGAPEQEEQAPFLPSDRPMALRPRAAVAVLRANLTPRSASFRHAVRLAVCLAVAAALARGLGLAHGYWIPMTIAIVLRPEFGATISRGLARAGGTLLGLLFATALAYLVSGSPPLEALIVGALVLFVRSVGAANLGLSAIAVTGLVVVLMSFAGARPEATIAERGLDTLVGGALALGAYLVWPTWERTQVSAILAALFDSYRAYFAAVMAGYLQPDGLDPARLRATRLAARLARSNAEASVDRLENEPRPGGARPGLALGLLANSHRFAHSVMAIEAGLYPRPPAPRPELARFAADADATLAAIAAALRAPGTPLGPLPDLRADQRALLAAAQTEGAAPDQGLAALTVETERMTNSLNTLTYLLQAARGEPLGESEPEALPAAG